ncbi:uncharacterized protein LOC142802999 [Rhipicephalus microplus]|uniref:uncharacterized protein LOC142802999 n=1 Tax=Rhipicephalus microplus TaxID=6941 RepID=UPI003F6C7DAF
MPYTLYNVYGSPPCATVRMLAKHIGVDLEVKNVDLFKREHLTPEYLKLNPFHKVPTFSDDGFIIYESSAICYYLLRKHAPSCDIYPDCPRTRARIDQALATITSTIQPHYFKFFRPRFYELTKPTPEDVEQFEENVIKGFEHVLGEGNYVLGDKLSLADLSLVAHLTLVFEVPFLNGDKYPKLKTYYNRLKAELAYFEEVNRPGITGLSTLTADLKYSVQVQQRELRHQMPNSIEHAAGVREPCFFIRMLAKHIGVELELKALEYDKDGRLPAEYAKISPLLKIPAINDDGFILYESTAICYYLLNKYAPVSQLYPKEVAKCAFVDQILCRVSSFVQPVASFYIRGSIVKRKKLTGNALRTFEETVLRPLEQLVGDNAFAVGDSLTVADIRLVSSRACFVPLPIVDKSKFIKVVSYYERIRALIPCFHEACGWMLEERSKDWETYEPIDTDAAMPYTLYNLYGSPPCATVRMLAKHIGVDLELKNVDPFKREHLTPEYLKLNPFHKIPTFSDEGFIIYESSAICYYLLRKHAPSCDIYPDCPRTRARIDQALATITSTIQPHYFKFFRPRFYELTKPTPEDVEQFEENVIKGFEHVLGEGNYVLGDKLSLADLSLVAHLTLVFEVPFLNGDKYPKLKAYYNRLKAELAYFEEVNRPGITGLSTLTADLK